MNLRDEMRKAGIRCESEIIVDGLIHRFRVEGKRAKNGWYVFHRKGDDVFGAFGDWATGFQSTLGAKTQAIQQELRAVKDRGEEKAKRAQARAACDWGNATVEDAGDHPYLLRKRVYAFGMRRTVSIAPELLIPMHRGGSLAGLQRIAADGTKRFTAGMRKAGTWFYIPGAGTVVVLCEGYATGASIHMATRLPVLVAFDCGNLLPAAEAFVAHAGKTKWIVAADNDQKTPGNPGLTKAFEAAHSLNGRLAMPFGTTGTDFNDLHLEHGLAAVTELIYGAL